MIIDRDRSLLLVVDLQARMVPAIEDHERVVANVVWLVRAAQRIGVPVAATEQYAKGLGSTVPEVRALEREGLLANLPRPLREVAELRLRHPAASLRELASWCEPPVSKAAAHRRLQRLIRLAEP